MAAVNVPDFRDNSLTPPPTERNTTGKGAQRKTRQGGAVKNPPSLPTATNKQIAGQAFHGAPIGLVPGSQLQGGVTNLERQLLKAKKAALQRQLQTLTAANPAPPTEEPIANPRASNFGLFYEHEGEESQLVHLMCEYQSVDIQYIRDIKKNKFKPENIMNLSTSVRCTRKRPKV